MPPKKRTAAKKTAAKKTTAKKTTAKAEAPQPMDPSAPEGAATSLPANHARVCYAIKTLVAEAHALFPEVPVEYSDYDGRNTALSVTFDLTVLDADKARFTDLIRTVAVDPRVDEVIVESDQILVGVRPGARTQDSRETFNLDSAWGILTDGEGSVGDDGWGGSW